MDGYGYPRKLIKDGINKGELNHATATSTFLPGMKLNIELYI